MAHRRLTHMAIARPSDSFARIFVWGISLAMLVADLAFVVHFSHSIPFQDDFEYTSFFTEQERPTLSWLWARHAEHRVPLAKLAWLGVLKVSGYDFRVGNVLTVS